MKNIILRKSAKKTTIKTAGKKKKVSKRSIRFVSDPMTLGYIDYDASGSFQPHSVGIILNESYMGCALIMQTDNKLTENQKIKIKLGNLDPIKAQIIWFKILEENIYKIGIKLLE